jgi:hypothetical protein
VDLLVADIHQWLGQLDNFGLLAVDLLVVGIRQWLDQLDIHQSQDRARLDNFVAAKLHNRNYLDSMHKIVAVPHKKS